MVPTFRVLCLSEVHDAMPMWNHYADGYKGVVLRFVAVKEVDSAFLVARPVVYQDVPPSIADVNTWVSRMLGQGEKRYQDLFMEYLYVKKCEWSYEKEWRIPAPGRRSEGSELFGEYGFHPSEVTAIYFGRSVPMRIVQNSSSCSRMAWSTSRLMRCSSMSNKPRSSPAPSRADWPRRERAWSAACPRTSWSSAPPF
jgi:hypothetical protein